MIATKGIRFSKIITWTGPHILWLFALMGFVGYLYRENLINFQIPWLATSVIGTALAFYIGFKNNQSYDRMWEARKIWGGIVNESRTWGMMVDSYISTHFSKQSFSKEQLAEIKQKLIYRHISWLYAHREQLLIPTPWEHVSQTGSTKRAAKLYRKYFGIGLVREETERMNFKHYLSKEEGQRMSQFKNVATQLINQQSRDLAELHKLGLVDDFRHVEMGHVLRELYTLQGKNERIKKFPFPRQYANMSRVFVGLFILMLPFSMLPELINTNTLSFWFEVLVTALIAWVYVVMEIVGDYSENPFQGMANDIPMLSLCRAIEIDLREMLHETELPPAIEIKKGVLM